MLSLQTEASMTFKAVDPYERFRSKFEVQENGCHNWISTIKRDGYGQFWFRGRPEKAHKAAYELFVGEIPRGKLVLHKCDNRICVNPEHLYLGTYRDNARDMFDRGRAWGFRRVTDEMVQRVLAALETGRSQQSVADELGIHQTTVSRIYLRRWQYVRRAGFRKEH
jgi:HNH endonuclease/Helix-turn-helix domain of transposase family ISL3